MKVLAFLEQRDGVLKSSSYEALTVAHKLANGVSADVAGVLIGKNISGLTATLKDWGADQIFIADHDLLQLYNPLTYSQALQKAVETFKPDVVVGIASPMGRDFFPRVAARLDAGLLTDLVEVSIDNGVFTGGIKPMYAGKALAQLSYQGEGLKMASIRPNVFKASATPGKGETVSLSVDLSKGDIVTVEIRKGNQGSIDLTEATRIISGGRSMGNAENFKILHECAEVLGAAVGASRAAVDAGYASHDMQVGQTGKTVNPNLYIACGISGMIQHMAGMRTSKCIVAINTNPEAAIFSIADYGIVADLFEAVPILTKKLKEILA
jgi:electron transfer flavoprotein alpha subunit